MIYHTLPSEKLHERIHSPHLQVEIILVVQDILKIKIQFNHLQANSFKAFPPGMKVHTVTAEARRMRGGERQELDSSPTPFYKILQN
jgi:hypothetical protein